MQTQWTEPTTDEQKRYFAKKGRLLNKYRSAIKWHSVLWLLFAFFGIRLGIAHLTEAMSLPTWLPGLLAFLLVVYVHDLLNESTENFCFDKLDNDPETNSSFWVPAMLILIVFFAERWGMQYLGEAYGYKAKAESVEPHTNTYTLQLATYRNVDHSAKSAALPYRSIINDLKRREIAQKKKFTTLISKEQKRLDDAVAKVEQNRTKALSDAKADFEADKREAKGLKEVGITTVTAYNSKEMAKQSSSEAVTLWGSWIIAIGFVLVYVGLNWRMASMGSKAGVRPIHSVTPLDKYGGIGGWFLVTFKDIFRRQAVTMAAFIHRKGTAGTQILSDLDTTLAFGQSQYNTPSPTPPPSHPDNGGGGNIRPLRPPFKLGGKRGANNTKSIASNNAENPVITASNNDYNPTVIGNAQKDIMELIYKIRPEFSNYTNPQHKQTTVLKRFAAKFALIDEIVEKYTPELIGEATMAAIRHQRTKYEALPVPTQKEAAA